MSKTYVPVDGAHAVTINVLGSTTDTQNDRPTSTGFLNLKVGSVTLNINGSTQVDGSAGAGESATSSAKIQYYNGAVWVDIAAATVSGVISNGTYGPTTATGPFAVTFEPTDGNLVNIEVRAWGTGTGTGGGTPVANAASTVTSWTTTVVLKSPGVIGA